MNEYAVISSIGNMLPVLRRTVAKSEPI